MTCESCKKNMATTHIKTVINGELKERHLCAECAQKEGYNIGLSGLNFDFGNFLGGLFDVSSTEKKVLRCEQCGSTFDQIRKEGKVGCPNCYKLFREQLYPTIKRIHGATKHNGKIPGGAKLRVLPTENNIVPVKESLLEEKKRLLKNAIKEQNYEQAAVLRDEIKEMETNE